jgi:hypothetical protein
MSGHGDLKNSFEKLRRLLIKAKYVRQFDLDR